MHTELIMFKYCECQFLSKEIKNDTNTKANELIECKHSDFMFKSLHFRAIFNTFPWNNEGLTFNLEHNNYTIGKSRHEQHSVWILSCCCCCYV